MFGYDDLQRMTSAARCSGAGCAPGTPDTFTFDDLGNITSKSDFASVYTYRTGSNTGGQGGPHAVSSVTKLDATIASYGYDANGNMTSGDGRTLAFDQMDRPVVVTQGTTTTEFAYAADGGRYRQRVKAGAGSDIGPRTVYSVDKDHELVIWDGGTMEERTYIGPSVVVVTRRTGSFPDAIRSARYLLADRLGSVQAFTDETSQAALLPGDLHDYDAWGKPRAWDETSAKGLHHFTAIDDPADPTNPNKRSYIPSDRDVTSDRGFTGHEHLDSHQLIHMNGRMYDPGLGRFLSVDPIISNPANPQSINPYSYIGNNPLSGTDPTGYESVGTGCGAFSKCDVTFVNPSPSSLKLYAPGNLSNEVQRSNGSPGLLAKQDCADATTCGAPTKPVYPHFPPNVRDVLIARDAAVARFEAGNPLSDKEAAELVGRIVDLNRELRLTMGERKPGGINDADSSVNKLIAAHALEVAYYDVRTAMVQAGSPLGRELLRQEAIAATAASVIGALGNSRLVSSPKHHRQAASPQPPNLQELYARSVVDSKGVRWSRDADGVIHRFSAPSNGEVHWNGSTAGPNPIRPENIPIEVRRALR